MQIRLSTEQRVYWEKYHTLMKREWIFLKFIPVLLGVRVRYLYKLFLYNPKRKRCTFFIYSL